LEHRALARNIVAQPFSMGNKLLGQVSTPNSLPRRFDVRPPSVWRSGFHRRKGEWAGSSCKPRISIGFMVGAAGCNRRPPIRTEPI
jgi:hypothetical protein